MKVSDEAIVTALMASRTNLEAAQSVGMTERAFYRRLQSESLQAKLRAVQEDILQTSITEMRKGLAQSVSVVLNIMNNPETAPQTRLNAADLLQRNYLKLSERADILDRLDRLEGLL